MTEMPRITLTDKNDVHYYDCDVLETFSMSSGTISYGSVARNRLTEEKIANAVKTQQDHRDVGTTAKVVNILEKRKPRVEEIGETALRVINRRRRKEKNSKKFKVENMDDSAELLCGLIEDAFSSILSKQNRNKLALKVRITTKQTPVPIRTVEFTGGCTEDTSSDSEDFSIFEDVDEDPLVDAGLAEEGLLNEVRSRREMLFSEPPAKENRQPPPLHTKSEIDKRLAKIGKKC
ncbi:unnamed protein product [Bursaphelenchus xylophilus]|uniref:(pine wood nematode) hypothetical protein n=1 Tax=Bursaphelenchus xylophilus TaxID=6326 RepID=A0A1I7S517_BURXY|nr:unnamed protein product [Bursaphelenchus xylophilus]CAG9117606.1 unnamed protein product [Bursaphelenchus xylophilus]